MVEKMNPYAYVCELAKQNITAAQQSIENAFLILLDEKELHQISVKELCERANVARSTFYAYYDVTDDCMQSIENRFLYEIVRMNTELKGCDKIESIDLSFFEETIQFIKDNQKMLYLFMNKRYNSRFVNRWKDAIKYHLYERIPHQIGCKNKELTLEIIASEAICAYQYWLKNPYELDIDYVKFLICRTIEAYTEE